MIYNKREYNQYIRQFFTNSDVEEFEQYELEIKKSDQSRRNLINQLKEIINEIKKTTNPTKKSILENRLITLQEKKSSNIPLNEFKITRFSVLSPEAKKYACASALLKKYLTSEIIKNNPLNFSKSSNGSLIINFEKLKNSNLHQLATNICNFVNYYFEIEGEKVKTANHFLNIYNNIKSIYDLNSCINKYYKKQREKQEARSAGKLDVIQIEAYPEQKLQIMRIIGPEGLNFESEHMGHCIRKDRYVEKLNTTAEYYSIRTLKHRRPNYPFVTIYFNEGELIEVVGKSNHSIADINIVNLTRNFIKSKLNITSDEELIHTDKIPETAKRNIGIIKDKDNIYHDLYNLGDKEIYLKTLPVTGYNLNKIKLHKIYTDTIWLQGNYNPRIFNYINKLASVNRLNIATQFNFGDSKKLDLSKLKIKNLNISATQLLNISEIIFPETLEDLEANSIDLKNIKYLDMRHCKNLRRICFRNSDLSKTNTILLPRSIQKIDIDYAKLSKHLTNRLTYFQNLLQKKQNNDIIISCKQSSKTNTL